MWRGGADMSGRIDLVQMLRRMALCAAWLGVSLGVSGCDRMIHGGQATEAVFSDPKVVALIHAAESGQYDRMTELVHQGVDVNHAGKDGMTPLGWVMQAHDKRGVGLLLEFGANPNQKFANGDSPTWQAAGFDDPEMLELFLQHHGDPNIVDKRETTALEAAVGSILPKNIDLLLQYGADLNYMDERGYSAAAHAVAIGHFELAAHLLDRGYSRDLQSLALGVQIRQVPPDSEAQRWKDRVIEMLKARGVNYPVRPLKPKKHRAPNAQIPVPHSTPI